MTERDLGTLLERASEHLAEVDFTQGAWSAAVAERQHRRRVVLGTVGAVAAAGLAVTAVQLGGSTTSPPTPATSSRTTAATPTLSDGTAYAVMPLEGKESQLPDFDAGLPSEIRTGGAQTDLSARSAPDSVVAVFLQQESDVYRPVLVTATGKQFRVDTLSLGPTHDAGGNSGTPLDPRAIGGGGRYIVFPQPGKVVRLDTHTGDTVTYPVPSQVLEHADWLSGDGAILARDESRAWRIDPDEPGASAVQVAGGYAGRFRFSVGSGDSGLRVVRHDGLGRATEAVPLKAPVYELAGETVGTDSWAASGAYFDQDVTSRVIVRGKGPIYQGLVAADVESGSARVLLAPENPDGQEGRYKGCCTVLGWADATTVLFQSVGRHGHWILAWNVRTGQVYEVSHIQTSASDDPVKPFALNVGSR
jgi:hypothetical protein